jgi:hypothetical protein
MGLEWRLVRDAQPDARTSLPGVAHAYIGMPLIP